MATAKLSQVYRTFFAKTLSKASSSTSNVEGASSSLSSRFLLEGVQSLLEVANASFGFTKVGKALAFETLPKVRSVDCLLPEDIMGGWDDPSVFEREVGRYDGSLSREESSKNPGSD